MTGDIGVLGHLVWRDYTTEGSPAACACPPRSGILGWVDVVDAANGVDTLAALKALTSRPASVLVKGKTAAYDGWGGVFVWIPESTTTADDALVIECTAGLGGRYKRLYNGDQVYAAWFGAKADGVANDQPALMAALATNRAVRLARGTYLCTSSLVMTTGQKLVGEDKSLVTLLFESVDGITFKSDALNSGNLHIEGITLRHSHAGGNNHKGLDLTACSYSVLRDVDVVCFKWALYLQRGPSGEGCYFNTFINLRGRCVKHLVEINDSVVGTSVNDNTFLNPFYEDVGTWLDGIAYIVTGYGNKFISPYGGGFTGSEAEFMRFAEGAVPSQSIVGNTLVLSPYIESSPKYGFRVPTTTSGRYGNIIIGAHFDGAASSLNYADPCSELTIIGTSLIQLGPYLSIPVEGAGGLTVKDQSIVMTGSSTGVQVAGPVDAVFGHTGAFGFKIITDGVPRLTIGANGTAFFSKALANASVILAQSANVTVDTSLGNVFIMSASSDMAFAIENPTAPTAGQRITIQIRNASGGILDTVAWGPDYRLAAWTPLARGFSRSIDFIYDGMAWIEVARTPMDVPN